jgi:chitin synthase
LYGGGYSLRDENDPQELNGNEGGDIPLLRRDNSGMSTAMPVPGAYDEPTGDDLSESNIRYGRIPQRVPRRYKTMKKVE